MDTRKMTLFATIAAIALLAVGIGYAYTASTTNSGNIATNEYVSLIQGTDGVADGAYNFANNEEVTWDSKDGEDGIVTPQQGDPYVVTNYTLHGASTSILTGYSLVKIGEDFNIRASKTGGENTTLYGRLTANNFDFDSKAVLFVIISQENEADQVFKLTANDTFNRGANFDGGNIFSIPYSNGYKVTAVSVYYGYEGTDGIDVNHAVGVAPEGPSAKPIGNAQGAGKLIFTIDSTLTSITPQQQP